MEPFAELMQRLLEIQSRKTKKPRADRGRHPGSAIPAGEIWRGWSCRRGFDQAGLAADHNVRSTASSTGHSGIFASALSVVSKSCGKSSIPAIKTQFFAQFVGDLPFAPVTPNRIR